jgi:hypothetical protein
VSLDSIVYAFLSGQSAEAIAQAFPVLSLEQVYGAIAYYLAHRDDIDRYLDSRRQGFAAVGRPRAMPTRCSIRSWPRPRSRLRSRAECRSAFRPMRI